MRNLLEYAYIHIDSDFILIGFTILYYKCDIKDSYVYLSTVYMTQFTVNFELTVNLTKMNET